MTTDSPGQQGLTRNESEKWRRDRLNAYIGELAKIVPLTMTSNKTSSKKMDKASVLRLTVTYLRIYHDLVKNSKPDNKWRPDILTQESLGQTILDSVGGFMLVVNKKGLLIFATDAIEEMLGHDLVDILGHPLQNIVHPQDHDILARQFTDNPNNLSQKPRLISTSSDSEFDTPVTGHRKFCIKMLNIKDKQASSYETIEVVGHIKTTPGIQPLGAPPGMHQPSEPEVHLIAIAKMVVRQPPMELAPILNSSENQWITRHEMDGKITYSDPRGAWWTGFMPGESIGLSAYHLLHPDDIGAVVSLHNSFLSAGQIPSCTFRMFTKSRDQLYVQTSTHMVIDMWTKKPRFIISINDVLKEDVGQKALQRQAEFLAKQVEQLAITNPETQSEEECREPPDSLSPLSHSSCSSPQSFGKAGSPMVKPALEVEQSVVNVKVGGRKFVIDLRRKDKFSPGPGNSAYDPHATNDTNHTIPLVTPKFLGDDDDNQADVTCISSDDPTSDSAVSTQDEPPAMEVDSIPQKIHIVNGMADHRKNGHLSYKSSPVQTTRVHLVSASHTVVQSPNTSQGLLAAQASSQSPELSSSLLRGLLKDSPASVPASRQTTVTEMDLMSGPSDYKPADGSQQDWSGGSLSRGSDISSVESVSSRCESPVSASVRDELTKQLLDHQDKLEASLREQQQELTQLKRHLGATSSDNANPKLQALEEKCQRHGEDLQALKVKLEHLNNLSQKSNGAPQDDKGEEPTVPPSGNKTSVSSHLNGYNGHTVGIQSEGSGVRQTADPFMKPRPSHSAGTASTHVGETPESLTSTLATLQSLAATQGSSLFETAEVQALVKTLVMVLSQAKRAEAPREVNTAKAAIHSIPRPPGPSAPGPSTPGPSTWPNPTPAPSSQLDCHQTKLKTLLSGKQQSDLITLSSPNQTTSATTITPGYTGSNGTKPYSNTENSTHLSNPGSTGKIHNRMEVSSSCVTSSNSIQSQPAISTPGGTSDYPADDNSQSSNCSHKFDMLRKILTEYKERHSDSKTNGLAVHETAATTTKGHLENEMPKPVIYNDSLQDNMLINVDHLLSQLGDELDLSVINEFDLQDLLNTGNV